MKVYCKKSYFGFEKGNSYEFVINSIFEPNDFITIKINSNDIDQWYRFRLNYSPFYVEDYIGENKVYFYDYFSDLNEIRKNKLEKISSVTNM